MNNAQDVLDLIGEMYRNLLQANQQLVATRQRNVVVEEALSRAEKLRCPECDVQTGHVHTADCPVSQCINNPGTQRVACQMDHEHASSAYAGDVAAEVALWQSGPEPQV